MISFTLHIRPEHWRLRPMLTHRGPEIIFTWLCFGVDVSAWW